MYNTANLNKGRAIACIVVLIHHILLAFYDVPIFLFNDGNLAVCFFLILCGFILPIKVFTQKDTLPNGVSGKIYSIFYYSIKRYLRLFTVVVLCNVIAYLILCGEGYYTTQFGEAYSVEYIYDFYAYNMNFKGFLYTAFVDSFIRGSSLDSPLWTIKYEFIGAILCRILVVFLYKNRYRHLGYLIIGSVCALTLKDFYWFLPVVGLFLSDLLFNTNDRVRIIDRFSTGIKHINIFVALALALIIYSTVLLGQMLIVIRSISALLLILCLLQVKSKKTNGLLERIATYSFHIYSIHWIIICSLGTFLMVKLTTFPYVLRGILTFIAIVVLTIMMAFMLKFVEDKINKRIIQPLLFALENRGRSKRSM